MIFLMFEKHKKFCLIFLHQKLHRNRFFLLAISDKRGEKIIFKNNFQLVSLNTCKSMCYFLKKVILGVKSVGVARLKSTRNDKSKGPLIGPSLFYISKLYTTEASISY